MAHVSGRIAVMYLGSLVEMGEAESLLTRPLRPYTNAFLSSEPVALSSHMRTTQRGILKGELPSPVSPPSGCRFRTRCAFARDLRVSQEPEWREVEPATRPPAISSVPAHCLGRACAVGTRGPPMTKRQALLIWSRLLQATAVIILATIAIFSFLQLVPGDPAAVIVGEYTTAERSADIRRMRGLDLPWRQQYFIWLGHAMPCRAISRPSHHRAGTRPRDHHRRSIGHPGCDEHG
jgi:oligopeptide/dipeptide ABC transporter ATP-binding protein